MPLPTNPWGSPGQVQQLGPYQILETLGQGGMGIVYKGRHVELGVVRAVKILLKPHGKSVGRFQRETDNLARVNHPNVAKIHEVGVHEGRLWFAMEFVQGTSLDQVLEAGRLPLDRALEIALGVCDGVAALHDAGVIHRDLKPANVVLTEDGRPIVLDLGLAVAPEQDERLTKTGQTLGTVTYMAPEQFSHAKSVTPATDVYALGLILFELTTGQPVLDSSEGIHAIAAKIMTEETPSPSSVDSSLPVALDAVCARATAREPPSRYPHAAGLRDAIEAVRAGPRTSRRRQRLALAALASLLLVGVALGLSARAARTRTGGALRGDSDGTPVEGLPEDPPGLSPAQVAEGDRELKRIERLPEKSKAQHLLRWRSSFPGHPRAAEGERSLAEALLHAPRHRLTVPEVTCAIFVGDGFRALIGTEAGVLQEWDLETGEALRTLVREPKTNIRDLANSPDRNKVLLGTTSWVIPELDLGSWELRKVIRTRGGTRRLAFSPDGKVLAMSAEDDAHPAVNLFDYPKLRHALRDVPKGGNLALVFSSDSRFLASLHDHSGGKRFGEAQGSVLVWDVDTGEIVQRIESLGSVKGVSFAPHANRYALASDGTHIRIHDINEREAVKELRGAVQSGQAKGVVGEFTSSFAHGGVVEDVAFAPVGDRLYSISKEANELRVWNAASYEEIHSVTDLPDRPVRLTVAPDGLRLLVVCGESENAKRGSCVDYWDLRGLADTDRGR